MDRLAATCEAIARWSSRLRKVAILADYLRALDDADLARAVRFLCCGPVFENSDAKVSLGYATLREALLASTGWDQETLAVCYREVGDSGETVALLLHERTAGKPLSLAEAERIYARLANARRTADKVAILRECFACYRPETLKYFIKVITGNLRIGLLAKQVEEAVAAATGVPLDEVKRANNRIGDLARVALAARHGTLEAIEARLFHPMDFMLAKPLDDASSIDPAEYLVEDKYDGIRSQVHVEAGRVAVFSRGMEDVTAAFPEIVEALRTFDASAVFDGELLGWRDDRALSFNLLQQRLARKKVDPALQAEIPAVFMAYDLLYANGAMLVDTPIELRRAALEALLRNAPPRVLLAPQLPAGDIDAAFEQARARGNEGLVLKRRGSLYEAGRRTGTWWKVKRAYATLDVVITAAEQGHGRRAIFLSDYTFAVRSGEGFVNVGKAYQGLTDNEVRELSRILRANTTDRFGRVALVKPAVVLEVAFDAVQRSPRHKGGYALRFPRILRWRRDKTPGECDDIEQVRALYEASLAK